MQKDTRSSFAVEVGARLAKAREAAGLSQADLSRRLGFENAANLSNWENGWAMFPPEYAARVFLLTKIDSNYLYLGDPSSLPAKLIERLYPAPGQTPKSRKRSPR